MPVISTPKSILSGFQTGELRDLFRLEPGNTQAALSTPPHISSALSHAAPSHAALSNTALSSALSAYHQDLGLLTPKLKKQLERLNHPRAKVVVAGQQAGLLGGPAFAIHKAADAILLALELDTLEAPILPIFWIASQDHDALEVASTTLMDRQERSFHLHLPLPTGRPIGRIPLQRAWVEGILAQLQDFDAPRDFKAQVLHRIEQAAQNVSGHVLSYADWFARLVSQLLGEYGLLILDPMHPAVAPLFANSLRAELENPLAGPNRIEAAAQTLLERGYTPQLRRPKGATNLFVEGDDGQRRLLRFDGKFFHAERRYTRLELEGLLERDPSRITPAAGLRPVVQDSALPTAALVLGPGEIGYLAQLLGVYQLHQLSQPLIWPRLSITWLEPPAARILKKYQLSAARFQADPRGSLERVLLERSGQADLYRSHLAQLDATFQNLLAQTPHLDPTLQGALLKAKQHQHNTLERLEHSLSRSLFRAESELESQMQRLQHFLLPLGVPQERELNFFSLMMKHGTVPLERLMAQKAGSKL
jgi:bacillithiol synthase